MLLRTLTILLTMATTAVAFAQTAQFHFYQCESAVNGSQFKFLIEEIINTDATAEIFHSDDMTVLQVKSRSGLGEAAYRSAIERTGVALRAGTPDLVALGLTPVVTDAPPVFISSGDQPADQARYKADVERWNLAHPDALMNATPIHTR